MSAWIRARLVGGSIVCASVASAQPPPQRLPPPQPGIGPDVTPASSVPSMFTLRRKLAVTAGATAVAAVGVGIARGLQAARREDDAYALCASPFVPCASAAAANHLVDRAHSRAVQANIAFAVAGVASIAAATLWLTGAPERRVAISPRVGSLTGIDLALRF